MNRTRYFVTTAFICLSLALSLAACGPKVYNDGTYRAYSSADDNGYALAEVVVQKDKIVSVELWEMDQYGSEKDFDAYDYEPAKKANKEMANRFQGRQDAAVDAYAGATKSSRKYKQAVANALEKARQNPEVQSTYFDGVFHGTSPISEDGYQVAWVTIEGDKITKVVLNEVTSEGQFRDWITYTYTTALEAKDAMEKVFAAKGDAAVDVFAGATKSSTGWIQAVNDALTKAKVR
jgi:uncharacterized protein with FMN-binding domain